MGFTNEHWTATGVLVCAIGVVVAVLAWRSPVPPPTPTAETISLPIAVYEAGGGGAPVVDARVSLNLPQVLAESTDSDGRVNFTVDKSFSGHEATILVTKDGYKAHSQHIQLASQKQAYRVPLDKAPPVSGNEKSGGQATYGDASPNINNNEGTVSISSGADEKPKEGKKR